MDRASRFRRMEEDGTLSAWAKARIESASFEEMVPLLAAVYGGGSHRTSDTFSVGSQHRQVFCDDCRQIRMWLPVFDGWWCRTCWTLK